MLPPKANTPHTVKPYGAGSVSGIYLQDFSICGNGGSKPPPYNKSFRPPNYNLSLCNDTEWRPGSNESQKTNHALKKQKPQVAACGLCYEERGKEK